MKSFIQLPSSHIFSESDNLDYSERDKYFIQCLTAVEQLMDIDAMILDFQNEKILYATKGGIFHPIYLSQLRNKEIDGFHFFNEIVYSEDITFLSPVHKAVAEFSYSLPKHRRKCSYYTCDFRVVKKGSNKPVLVNLKESILDITDDGVTRLGLFVFSYPTHDKPGNAYIKMNDTGAIYEYMHSSQKLVEVKTQKITSKSYSILKLSSIGKTESEISKILGISVSTVKYHKKRIFAQTDTKNISEAIQWANNQKNTFKKNKKL